MWNSLEKISSFTFLVILCEEDLILVFVSWFVVQVYTRSVIDPIPAPTVCPDGEAASKAADRQKKKSKMSDEEIMDKLSKPH